MLALTAHVARACALIANYRDTYAKHAASTRRLSQAALSQQQRADRQASGRAAAAGNGSGGGLAPLPRPHNMLKKQNSEQELKARASALVWTRACC